MIAQIKKFADRKEAGKLLASVLKSWKGKRNAIVLALPRGGVVVGAEIARSLDLPMDLMLVRKLGAPGNEELAMGALAIGEVCIWNEDILGLINPSHEQIAEIISRESKELLRRNEKYRGEKPAPDLKGRQVILVDDGMATGADMRAAVLAARKLGADYVLVAVPVSSDSAYELVSREADKVISLLIPSFFMGVGSFYEDFSQTEDEEVLALMKQINKG